MASRMKKLFRKDKDEVSQVSDDRDQQMPSQRMRREATPNDNAAPPATLYQTTSPGGAPQIGGFPIKGDGRMSASAGGSDTIDNRGQHARTDQSMSQDAFTDSQSNPQYYGAQKQQQQQQRHLHAPISTTTTTTTSNYANPYSKSKIDPRVDSSPPTETASRQYANRDSFPDRSADQGGIRHSTAYNSPASNFDDDSNVGSMGIREPSRYGFKPPSGLGEGRPRQDDAALSQGLSNLRIDSGNTTQPARGQLPSHPSTDFEPALSGSTLRNEHVGDRDAKFNTHANHLNSSAPNVYHEASPPTRNNDGLNRPVPGGPRAAPFRSSMDEPDNYGYSHASTGQPQDGNRTPRSRSIPRKQVGISSSTPAATYSTSPSSPTHAQRSSIDKPLPTAPLARDSQSAHRGLEFQPSTDSPRRPLSTANNPKGISTARDVVDRAQNNTYDTEVIERIAPAVVHETVTKDVHHIRQELITREIHEHDVYHRIQPVIDVEVLPPRHFLPVEGGGLVEIHADEVPGRGRNWVIAETASKIPSDEKAPNQTNHFSARQFPGSEGDSTRYMTSEGYERTEQTWVHPPELETGGRYTGQTWPMIFGDSPEKTVMAKPSSPKSHKRKSSRKSVSQPTDQYTTDNGYR